MDVTFCAVGTCPFTMYAMVGGLPWCRKHAESARIDWEIQLSLDTESVT